MGSSSSLLTGVGRIPLRRRDGTVRAWATVDLADFKRIAAHRWRLGTGGYAVCGVRADNGKQWTLGMHRAVMGLGYGDPLEVDHLRDPKLDNRRCNLRIVTQAQNAQNRRSLPGATSPHRGVSWWASHRKWAAQVVVGRKHHHLGYFDREEDARDAVVEGRARLMPFSVDD